MSDDAKRPLLVLLAHPDDEFAVFPWLQAAVSAGRRTCCIWLTDGGAGGQDIQRRNQESICVLQQLGLTALDMHFVGAEWNVPDGALYLRLDDVVPRLVNRFAHFVPAAELLIPAWEGGHHDHDAAHLAGIALAVSGSKVRQYSLYHGEGLSGPWFRVLSPLRENGPNDVIHTTLWERLGHAGRCLRYSSQWRSFLGLLPFYLLKMLRKHPFVLQPVDPARTVARPHEGLLLYERRGGPTWSEFAERTRQYRELGMDHLKGS